VTPAELIDHLDRARLGDLRVDGPARRAYVERFVGFDDTRSSVRTLEVIESGAL
jgi:hypothetical protein